MNVKRGWIVGAGAAGLLGVLALVGAGVGRVDAGPAGDPVVAPIPVRLATVELTTARPVIAVAARLARQSEAALAFKVPGRVAEVTVREGDSVRAGQLLAVLDLEEVSADLARAEAAIALAERDLQRVRELRAAAVVPPQELDRAENVYAQALATRRLARFNRQYAEILAPADGQILGRSVEPGEWVSAGRSVLVFAGQNEPWLARVGLAERVARQLTLGALAEVQGTDGSVVTGVLRHLGAALDPLTRTLPAEIELHGLPPVPWSGQVARVLLQPDSGPERTRLPASALVEGAGDSAWVVVVAGGVARRLPVQVDAFDGPEVYLSTRLPTGTQVVVAGAEMVRDGQAVLVVP